MTEEEKRAAEIIRLELEHILRIEREQPLDNSNDSLILKILRRGV